MKDKSFNLRFVARLTATRRGGTPLRCAASAILLCKTSPIPKELWFRKNKKGDFRKAKAVVITMNKSGYLDLMDKVLAAYSDEDVRNYFDEVRREGVREHGFPRLCADLGILIANGRRQHQKELFCEMMDICTADAPVNRDRYDSWPRTGNDFSVKEIVFALLEAERSGIFPKERTDRWRASLSSIDPYTCYNVFTTDPSVRKGNWAAFSAISEQMRVYASLGGNEKFVSDQIGSQLLAFDENGMYRDPHEPMVYDLVTRLQLSLCLRYGYRGPGAEKLDALLEKAGLLTLRMQSVTGEIPYGGRSAQYLHNEAMLAAVAEYEAERYRLRGDAETEAKFRRCADRACAELSKCLSEPERISHIKNQYDRDSRFGCEQYGYFKKYMVTAASNLYLAALSAGASSVAVIPSSAPDNDDPDVFETTEYFHKVFLRAGDYCAEYDTKADPHYDASGLGRVHRRGVTSAVCLSVPAAVEPNYKISSENPCPLSLAPWIIAGEERSFGGAPEAEWSCLSKKTAEDSAEAKFSVRFPDGAKLKETCRVDETGVTLLLCGEKERDFGRMIPAFDFDGKDASEIVCGDQVLTVTYHGSTCRYETDGTFADSGLSVENRNGRYRVFFARKARDAEKLRVTVTLGKKN